MAAASASIVAVIQRCGLEMMVLCWRYTVKKYCQYSQESCTSQLAQETCTSITVSCTSFFLYKFLAPNITQLYCVRETCAYVTKTERSEWLAV